MECFRCHDGKVFVSREFAQQHIRRRYPEHEWASLDSSIVAFTPSANGAHGKAKAEAAQLREKCAALEAIIDEMRSAGGVITDTLKEELGRAREGERALREDVGRLHGELRVERDRSLF